MKWLIVTHMPCYAKSLQLCPTLCDPIDSSPPGSPVPGILQARTLKWVAISLSNVWKWKVKVKLLSRVWLFATPWTIQSMDFSRPEYWCGYPFPSPWTSPGQNIGVGTLSLLQGIVPTQGLNPSLPTLQVDSLPAEPPGKPKNTGVGSLAFLQGIFPTQESNWGLLQCRWILYQLSYQGSPRF